jgi:hypothetical protein
VERLFDVAGTVLVMFHHAGFGGGNWMRCVCYLLFGLIAVLGCGKTNAKNEEAYYRIEVEKKAIGGDGFAQVLVRFVGDKGYHWNTDFKPMARVVSKEGVVFEKEEFSKRTGDFVDNGDEGLLGFRAKPDGSASRPVVGLKVRFSMCTKKECRVFDDVPVEVTLDAR